MIGTIEIQERKTAARESRERASREAARASSLWKRAGVRQTRSGLDAKPNALAQQLERIGSPHERDLASGAGWVDLPGAFAHKLPAAADT